MDLRQAFTELQTNKAEAERQQKEARAPLIEVFHSIQGEGRYVGVPMTFVRTATCPLRCLYCDTPNSYEAPSDVPIRFGPRTHREPNPVRASRAAELVRQVSTAAMPGLKASRVSLTGGEPLVFPEFVHQFGKAVREAGARLHLETAALDPEALAACINQVDHLSADYKLPETLGDPQQSALALAKGRDYGASHLRCCEIALRRGASVDLKIVLTDSVSDPALEQALELLLPIRDKIQLIMQPVTPHGSVRREIPASELERFIATAVRQSFDVRVIPQTHKVMRLP
jgi:7-carboxy-7-deazaguanine synthase